MTRDKLWLLAIVATFFAYGLVDPRSPNYGRGPTEASVAFGFVFWPLLFAWCNAHAAAHHLKPPVGAPLLVGIAAPVGLPYYFLRVYAWPRALLALLKAALVFVLCTLLYVAGVTVGTP